MKTPIEEKFSNFYEKWMMELEDLLELLEGRRESPESDYVTKVNKLTTHHKNYYKFKWAAAHEDILAFFTPVWLSPHENAHLWITGWKPSTAFRLVEQEAQTRLSSLTEEQKKNIAALSAKIKMEEGKVESDMERQHMELASRKMVELVKLKNRAERRGGLDAARVSGSVDVMMQGLLVGLERVMKMADCVRLKALKGVLDILSPMQGVQFLASMSILQIRVRKME
ncbi:transcription factor hbp-1b(c38) [Phtheirospermum japonicum]|uniref:Transcription factor hbp-1b(C38) n=1 Tax=Phtheirospermum japonicum TaxID=374723 RepID=A0A830BUR2_9LAMI|nr:transcription factor hbp-1b(c38) [Phtheirospermum japonicum]